MAGPMEGVRVVELGAWVAGPSAAAILGDWGANVIKIEPPDGDPFRFLIAGLGGGDAPSPPFELDNRNKRSICIDLSSAEGKAVAQRLVDDADVFVTNIRPVALERAGLSYEEASARNPRLVYASITGYGLDGDDRDRAAYDVGAFWSRAGVAAALCCEGSDLPYQRGGMGDHMAGMAAAGGVAAALHARSTTGVGQLVSTSLFRIGMYMLGWDMNMALRLGVPTVPMSREAVLASRPARRPALARRAPRHRPPGLGDRRTVLLVDRPVAALRRAGRRPRRDLRHEDAGGVG